jgi:hypothetical protein
VNEENAVGKKVVVPPTPPTVFDEVRNWVLTLFKYKLLIIIL